MKIPEGQLVEFAKSIELLATKVLEGSHLSRRGGEGIEFHSARPYTEGEDARAIDWKRFAATDKYFVKKFEREEKTGFSILVDSSPSMDYGAKKLWIQSFVGSLIFLATVRGDSWQLPPLDQMNVEEAFRLLIKDKVGWKAEEFSPRAGDRIILISDFMFEPESLLQKLKDWEADGHLLHLVQILDPQEAQFKFEGVLEFRDYESSGKLLLDSRVAKTTYARALLELQQEWSQLVSEPSFFVTYTASPEKIEEQLSEFFERLA